MAPAAGTDLHSRPTARRRPRQRRRVVRTRHRHAHQEHPPQARGRPAQPALPPDRVRHRLQVRGAVRRMRSRDWRRAPPWWPENEPWPPVRGSLQWRRHRTRFVRRAGAGLSLLLFLVVLGAQQVMSWLFGGSPFPERFPRALWAFGRRLRDRERRVGGDAPLRPAHGRHRRRGGPRRGRRLLRPRVRSTGRRRFERWPGHSTA